MNFQFNVTPSKEFTFTPSDLMIYVGNRETIQIAGVPTEIVNIQTVLTQNINGGTIKEDRQHQFPVAFLDTISGFDTVTMKPTINAQALDVILASFNLSLTK